MLKYELSSNHKDRIYITENLPNKLRNELTKCLFSNIKYLDFFKNKPNDFISYVSCLLKPIKFPKDHIIHTKGDILEESKYI